MSVYPDGMNQVTRLDRAQHLADVIPIPTELHGIIAEAIEPIILEAEIKHRGVMDAIRIAWPHIRWWLAAHPEEL